MCEGECVYEGECVWGECVWGESVCEGEGVCVRVCVKGSVYVHAT